MVVAVLPAIVLALALMLTVGSDCATVTVTDCDALPPGPVQERVYVVLARIGGVVTEPDGSAAAPLRLPPDAEQLVAFPTL
jgi:hypothetical protein